MITSVAGDQAFSNFLEGCELVDELWNLLGELNYCVRGIFFNPIFRKADAEV